MSPTAIIFGACFAWLAAVVSPGPNFLVVSRLALARSRRASFGATVGIAAASLAYAVLTMFGLGVIILEFSWLGTISRIAGGGYLVWLGVQSWWSSDANSMPRDVLTADADGHFLAGVRAGLIGALSISPAAPSGTLIGRLEFDRDF